MGRRRPSGHPVNGDRATYLDHTFACTWLKGEAYVADDESLAVGWFTREQLPAMKPVLRQRIECALAEEPVTRFRC